MASVRKQHGLFGVVCPISMRYLLACLMLQTSSDDMEAIENDYVIHLYQRISTLGHVNDARKLFLEIFGNRIIEIVPPYFVHWSSM